MGWTIDGQLIYLKLTCTNAEIVDSNLQGILPRKIKKGRKATILTVEEDARVERWWYPHPVDLLTREQKKRIVANVIAQLTKLVFSTHIYEWQGKIFLQVDGGPIGLRATGPVSRILMDHWREVMKTLEENNRVEAQLHPGSSLVS